MVMLSRGFGMPRGRGEGGGGSCHAGAVTGVQHGCTVVGHWIFAF